MWWKPCRRFVRKRSRRRKGGSSRASSKRFDEANPYRRHSRRIQTRSRRSTSRRCAPERTGDIKQALTRYVSYQEELDKVRKKVVAALIYPAILVVVGALVLGFLLLYVVPRFARVYEDISADLPFFSGLLLSVGRWVDANGLAVIGAGIALSAAAAYALARPRVRAAVISKLLATSLLAQRVRTYQLARLYRTVGMLLRAGVPAVKCLDMVRGILPPHQRAQ